LSTTVGKFNMKVVLTYVYPDLDARTYVPLARRFVESYMEHPPGSLDHEIHVLVNYGLPNNPAYPKLFRPLTCSFMLHDNQGKDIGAFQKAAEEIPCDLMVFLGAPIHFYRAGWLDRIVNVYEQNGPGLYGCRGYTTPMHHLRTTSFWCAPELLNSYPYTVHNDSRYEFEHGVRSITQHVRSIGLECFMVTWDGCYPYDSWGRTPNGSNLMLDQWSDMAGEKE